MTVKEYFESFMNKHGALDNYKKYVPETRYDTMCSAGALYYLVSGAFSWEDSEEGFEYWSNISGEWEKEISRLAIEMIELK